MPHEKTMCCSRHKKKMYCSNLYTAAQASIMHMRACARGSAFSSALRSVQVCARPDGRQGVWGSWGSSLGRRACAGGARAVSAQKYFWGVRAWRACVGARGENIFLSFHLCVKPNTRTDGGRCFRLLDRRESSILASSLSKHQDYQPEKLELEQE